MPPWVKLSALRATHRKFRAAGFAARGLDEAACCQIALDGTADGLTEGHKKDGFISDATVEMLAVAHGERRVSQLISRLCSPEVARWERDADRGGYWVHDYLEDNPTKTEWEATVEGKRRAGAAGGRASGQARAEALASALASESRGTDDEAASFRLSVSTKQTGRRSSPNDIGPGGRIPPPRPSCDQCTEGFVFNEVGDASPCPKCGAAA